MPRWTKGIELRAKSLGNWQEKGTLTTYCKAVKNLLEMYATDEVIAEADAEVRRITQLENKTPIEHAEFLCTKILHCECEYVEYVLMGTTLRRYKIPLLGHAVVLEIQKA